MLSDPALCPCPPAQLCLSEIDANKQHQTPRSARIVDGVAGDESVDERFVDETETVTVTETETDATLEPTMSGQSGATGATDATTRTSPATGVSGSVTASDAWSSSDNWDGSDDQRY